MQKARFSTIEPLLSRRWLHNQQVGRENASKHRGSHMSKPIRKTNADLVELIGQLKAQSRDTGVALWRDVAQRLSKSRKNWAQPNLSRVTRYAPEDATILVPGKLLGSGESDTIEFTAPNTSGDYEFLCSFPAHLFAGMRGVMTVE